MCHTSSFEENIYRPTDPVTPSTQTVDRTQHVESSKSREETLAGSFMGAASRVHTTTSARPLHVVYTTHIRILRSRISRYPDPEVGNSILLSTLEFAQHLPRANPAHSPIIVKSSSMLLLAEMPVVIRDTLPRVYYVYVTYRQP